MLDARVVRPRRHNSRPLRGTKAHPTDGSPHEEDMCDYPEYDTDQEEVRLPTDSESHTANTAMDSGGRGGGGGKLRHRHMLNELHL